MPADPDAGTTNPWLAVYLIYAVAALGVGLACLFIRVVYGASPAYLARTRCYELPPLRILFHAFHVGVWLAFVAAWGIVLRYGWAYYETSANPYGLTALAAAGGGLGMGLLGWGTFVALVRIRNNRPPTVAVKGIETVEGIDSHRLANLGREQFLCVGMLDSSHAHAKPWAWHPLPAV